MTDRVPYSVVTGRRPMPDPPSRWWRRLLRIPLDEPGRLLNLLAWVVGWCGVTWSVAELTTLWVWPASLGLLLTGIGGWRPLWALLTNGVRDV
jgi:hypothetical protein